MFTGRAITAEFAQETLRDLLRAQQQAISIANIQKVVADYYGLQIKDLLSKRRTRSLARPRQMAMALAKERSEEHTSEPQSLMRTSYAVLCLQKKKKYHSTNT